MLPPILTFHATGDWGPGQVPVEWTTSSRPVLPEVERMIEQAWSEATRRPGVYLFDGPMCRLESWQASPEVLRLALAPTSYKPFLGTNLAHPELADRYGRQILANPVGVSPALLTADGYLMFGRRNESVAYYPGRTHPFAGALEPRDGSDVFAAVRRELQEELSLGEDDIIEVRCTGIAEDRALRQPELIFRASCARTRGQIEERMHDEEHHASWSIPADSSAIERAARDEALTPVAIAALLLFGRARFGDEWFRAQEAALRARRGP